MYTRDRSTDYEISVAYALQHRPTDARVKASNTTNLKKAFRHAGRLFETACLRQTKSSFYFFSVFAVSVVRVHHV